ncbi:hypothetical protein ACVW16_004202 [Bradyrhizobium sp. USDA 4474]
MRLCDAGVEGTFGEQQDEKASAALAGAISTSTDLMVIRREACTFNSLPDHSVEAGASTSRCD